MMAPGLVLRGVPLLCGDERRVGTMKKMGPEFNSAPTGTYLTLNKS